MFKWIKRLRDYFRPKVIVVPIEKPNKKDEGSFENPWSVVSYIPEDSTNVLKIEYTNELGMKTTDFCRAIFESSGAYKLVAPWMGPGKVLQKANITDIQISDVVMPSEKDF